MNNDQPTPVGNLANNIGQGITNVRDSISNVASNVATGVQNGYQNVSSGVQNVATNVQSSYQNVKQGIADYLPQQAAMPTAPAGFFDSNTLIFKTVFLILVVIVFLFLFRIGIALIGYFMRPSNTPYLINGLVSGNSALIIPRDPKKTGAVTLLHSNDQPKGLEFTWSFWLNLQPNTNKNSQFSNIFNVGNATYDSVTGLANVSNAPGVYLRNLDKNGAQTGTADLMIQMDVIGDGKTDSSSIEVTDLPYSNWVNVILRPTGNLMDVYINGTISGRLNFINTPRQNYEDVNIAQNGGFNGSLSNLRYYDYALNVFEIGAVVVKGPNTTPATIPSSSTNTTLRDYNYLSNLWYSQKL